MGFKCPPPNEGLGPQHGGLASIRLAAPLEVLFSPSRATDFGRNAFGPYQSLWAALVTTRDRPQPVFRRCATRTSSHCAHTTAERYPGLNHIPGATTPRPAWPIQWRRPG